jgi:hypothetical protein
VRTPLAYYHALELPAGKPLEQGPARHLPIILDGGAVSMSPLRAWKVQVSGRSRPDLFRRSDRFPVGSVNIDHRLPGAETLSCADTSRGRRVAAKSAR